MSEHGRSQIVNSGISWRSWMQLIFGLGLTFLFFYMMAPFIVAILLGAITAILCYPLYTRLRRKTPRALAALAVTLGVTLGVLLPFVIGLIGAAQELLARIAAMRLPRTGASASLLDHPLIRKFVLALSRVTPFSQDWLNSEATDLMQTVFEKVSHAIGSFLAGLPALGLGLFVVIISFYFFLMDGSRFLRFLSSLSPVQEERSQELYLTFQNSCRGVVLGLFASALTQGILISILFLATGIPNASLMGVVGILLGMVPVVGTAPITLGAIIYLFGTGAKGAAIVMVIGAVIVATIDNVIRSLIMKGQSEMHPLLALVSVFGATNLVGPPGIFLGPVIAAVFVSFLKILSLQIRHENLKALQ